MPFNLFGEYSLSRDFGAWLSFRMAYSIEQGDSGLLRNGWLGDGPPQLSFGAVWRKR
jgi:hypothetical protein